MMSASGLLAAAATISHGDIGGGGSQPHPAMAPQHPQQQQQHFCLKWNNHTSNMLRTYSDMLELESFVDVTLACDGYAIKAHKTVLSANSNYFKELFMMNPCKHPIVILKDMKFEELRAIVDFMYKGEVNVSQAQLGALLKTAEVLRVKGLTDVKEPHDDAQSSSPPPPVPAVKAEPRTVGYHHAPALPEQQSIVGDSIAGTSASSGGFCATMPTGSNGQSPLVPAYAANGGDHVANLPQQQQPTTDEASAQRKRRRRRIVKRIMTVAAPQQQPDPKGASENNGIIINSVVDSVDSGDQYLAEPSVCGSLMAAESQEMHEESGLSDDDEQSGSSPPSKRLLSASTPPNTTANLVVQQSLAVSSMGGDPSSSPTSNQQLAAVPSGAQFMQGSAGEMPLLHDTSISNDDGEQWEQPIAGHSGLIGRDGLDNGGDDLNDSDPDVDDDLVDVRPIVSFDEGTGGGSSIEHSMDGSGSGGLNTQAGGSQPMLLNPADYANNNNSGQSGDTPNTPGKICVCHLCHLTFTAYSSLRRHMARHYADRERYECDICFKSYSRKDYLKEHKKLKHAIN